MVFESLCSDVVGGGVVFLTPVEVLFNLVAPVPGLTRSLLLQVLALYRFVGWWVRNEVKMEHRVRTVCRHPVLLSGQVGLSGQG